MKASTHLLACPVTTCEVIIRHVCGDAGCIHVAPLVRTTWAHVRLAHPLHWLHYDAHMRRN